MALNTPYQSALAAARLLPSSGTSVGKSAAGPSPGSSRSFRHQSVTPMKNNLSSETQTPEGLLTDLRALVSEAESMIAGAPGAEDADAVTTLRARFEAAQERLGEVYASARKNVVAGAKYTDQTIRANPYQSLA